ncbi:haloacid dehalogenase [Astrocystis sublimbata]|nr:haloacid dehalogenase [Astrocystis sublimbata]
MSDVEALGACYSTPRRAIMAPSNKVVIAFDLYGTLLSTDSIATELAKIYGEDKAQSLATAWRRYQLEYTWRSNSMGQYKSFKDLTLRALVHAVVEQPGKLKLWDNDAATLMEAYDALHVFAEIPAALQLLQENSGALDAYVFSNGTDDMVGNSIRTSPELGPHAGIFRSLVTVDSLRCFKPDPRTYAHLVEQAGKKGHEGDVWVVSANAFDIVGARAAGLQAVFIDRSGKGWVDRLHDKPEVIVGGVDEAVRVILSERVSPDLSM